MTASAEGAKDMETEGNSPVDPTDGNSGGQHLFRAIGHAAQSGWAACKRYLSTSVTSMAYRMLLACLVSLLFSAALWLLVLTLLNVGQDRSASWNSIGQLFGGTVVTAAAGWLVKTLPPLQTQGDESGQKRFIVMCLVGTFTLLGGEYWLWYNGRLPTTFASEALSKQIIELRAQVVQTEESLRRTAAYLDAHSETWQHIPPGERRWQRFPALANERYRLDLRPDASHAASKFEVVVLDDEGKLLTGRSILTLAPIRLYAETGSSSRSLTIGIRWQVASETPSDSSKQLPELTLDVTALRVETSSWLTLDSSEKLLTLEPSTLSDKKGFEFRSDAGRYDTGSCGGGHQPDALFRMEVKQAGWVKLGLIAQVPAAVYLMSVSPDPSHDKKSLAREVACDDSALIDRRPGLARVWHSDVSLAVNAGSYIVLADSKEGPGHASIDYSIEPFLDGGEALSAEKFPQEVVVDMLGSPAMPSCNGAREAVRDLHITGDGPFLATVAKHTIARPYGLRGTGSSTIPFSTEDDIRLSWYRESENPANRCGNILVGDKTDRTLRIRLKIDDPPPVVKIRLQRALTQEARNESMARACKNAPLLEPNRPSSILVEKDDNFAVQLSSPLQGKITVSEDAIGVGAPDVVRQIRVRRRGITKLTVQRQSNVSNFVAYLLRNCTSGAIPVVVDRTDGFDIAMQQELEEGIYFLVIDGVSGGDHGEVITTVNPP